MGCHLCRDDWTSVNGEAGFALSLVAGSHPGRGFCFKPPLYLSTVSAERPHSVVFLSVR